MRGVLPVIFLLFVSFLSAQNRKPDSRYQFRIGSNPVLSKNYYLLSLFSSEPELRSLLSQDEILALLAKAKADTLANALKECGSASDCYIARLKFTEEEISIVSKRLLTIFSERNALGNLVSSHLLPSGAYILYDSLQPAQLIVKAWEQDARGINFALSVYAQGRKPNYPNIDSASLRTRNPGYANFLYSATYELVRSVSGDKLFFRPSLNAALRFLEYNERNDAGNFEPMTKGVNEAAFQRVTKLNFSNYPYSLILVPGAGPDEADVALSAEAMLRMRMAVNQYQKGMAPFILVSGGKVHPYKTKYCEAIEMKRFLMENLSVPENAILVDPHARHTTTNLRNTARIIFRYGIPFDKPVLTSTSRAQSLMISNTLAARCMAELNEIPFRVGKRLTETEVEIYPLLQALQIDPEEPMDP